MIVITICIWGVYSESSTDKRDTYELSSHKDPLVEPALAAPALVVHQIYHLSLMDIARLKPYLHQKGKGTLFLTREFK